MKASIATSIRKIATTLCIATLMCGSVQAAESKIVVDGSTTVGPICKAFAEYMKSKDAELNISVSESGSGNGAKALMNNTCDVAAMSRFMKPTEFKAAVDKEIMPVAHVVAMDGLAIVVHPSNPVSALTSTQIHDIYIGKISNWNQVGGPDVPIVKVTRDGNSGTFETFNGLIMKEEKMAGDVETVNSNGQARIKVQTTKAAIAYIGIGFVDKTVKPVTVDGIKCTARNISTGFYPIARPLYLFTNGYPKLGSAVHQFVTLHLSEKGQEIVETIGFVPVTEY